MCLVYSQDSFHVCIEDLQNSWFLFGSAVFMTAFWAESEEFLE